MFLRHNIELRRRVADGEKLAVKKCLQTDYLREGEVEIYCSSGD